MYTMHAASSGVENSAHVSSCQLKFAREVNASPTTLLDETVLEQKCWIISAHLNYIVFFEFELPLGNSPVSWRTGLQGCNATKLFRSKLECWWAEKNGQPSLTFAV